MTEWASICSFGIIVEWVGPSSGFVANFDSAPGRHDLLPLRRGSLVDDIFDGSELHSRYHEAANQSREPRRSDYLASQRRNDIGGP